MVAERRVGNLPEESNRLVGRRAELAQVTRACGRHRLVTVTGVGGVGKTRLARRAADELQPSFADGAWWMELSPLSPGMEALPYAVAEALPLADQTTRPMWEVIAEYLAGRKTLLVWNTCEHLVEECRQLAGTLLSMAPGLRILATSRRPLGLPAEEVLILDPLPVPVTDEDDTTDAMLLLADRAAQAVPGFTVTDADRAQLAALCRRLEGLPLALELAAARLREMPVAELNQRLDDRYAVLGDTDGGNYGVRPRWHQALRTAIGWSHELCTPAERLLWARLSVFAGSFDSEAARQVCADAQLPGEEVPSLLGALVEKSILTWVPTGGGERYRTLDTIREFGTFWLHELGEEEALRCRHRAYFLALARAGDAAWLGPHQFTWYDRMADEHDNLRAALEFCLAEPDGHAALELAGALWFFWYACGFAREGRHYLDRALAADTAPSGARTQALWAAGLAAVGLGDAESAAARSEEGLAAAEQQGDDALDPALGAFVCAVSLRGDLAAMEAVTDRIFALPQKDDVLTLAPLFGLQVRSHVLISAGEPAKALTHLERLRTLCDRHGERWTRAFCDYFQAQAELALGRPDAAQHHAREALRIKHRLHDRMAIGLLMDTLAVATGAAGQAERAAWLLGLAHQVWDTLGAPQMGQPQWVAARQACERQARAALGDHGYQLAFDTGHATDLDTGIAEALIPADPAPRSPAQPGATG
ncbi:hypothetical protein GCM10010365_38400 [Streptomyces poonensis]|uniref:Orc1-like AAA ATPase domain-containing protein n=1 Tax=Streptomyces poonensis TaxID=68255 RepID=A0A918PMQ6_9ACTN|nr:hypothetical protein GCM10010365_38400 [Streptomyces poonensis]GLJ91444.1 hypothetical protein GCM10017589_40510 [Streptomyces poonensis]